MDMSEPNEKSELSKNNESSAEKAERHAEKGLRSDLKSDDLESMREEKGHSRGNSLTTTSMN